MEDKKQSAGEILPKDKKHLKENMPDHLKSPLFDKRDKKEVAEDKEEKEEEN